MMTIYLSNSLNFLLPIAIVLLIILIILGLSIRLIRQNQQAVIERFGSYYSTWKPGVHFLIPFIDKVVKKIHMTEQNITSSGQFLSLDEKEINIDFDIVYQPVDSIQYAYNYQRKNSPLTALVSHYLRINVGSKELRDILPETYLITPDDYQKFDEVTDHLGVKIKRIYIKKISFHKGEDV